MLEDVKGQVLPFSLARERGVAADRSPVEAFGRVITIEHQVHILLGGELFETVVVNPGDFIFGDIDGALVIPKELTLKVLLEAERIAGIENASRKGFKTGEEPVEVFKRHRWL